MKLHNYTPHIVRIFTKDGKHIELKSEGIARVEGECKDLGEKKGIDFCEQVVIGTTGLPKKEKHNHYYIVSTMVLLNSDRKDLVAPTDYVYNQQGLIVGCRKLKMKGDM